MQAPLQKEITDNQCIESNVRHSYIPFSPAAMNSWDFIAENMTPRENIRLDTPITYLPAVKLKNPLMFSVVEEPMMKTNLELNL